MILWAVLLLVAVWLCAYAGLKRSAFYRFYAVAVIVVPAMLAAGVHGLGMAGAVASPVAVFVSGLFVAGLAYPISHWRLKLER